MKYLIEAAYKTGRPEDHGVEIWHLNSKTICDLLPRLIGELESMEDNQMKISSLTITEVKS